jgi:long-chain acyl-CoA synthetase
MFVGVPAMYAMMSEVGLSGYDLSGVRFWASAADAMPQGLAEEFRKAGRFMIGPIGRKALFLDAYGMVELSSLATVRLPLPGVRYPPNCVGFPVPPVRIRVLDESGARLGPGEVGELAVKGPSVMKGYWRKPDETKAQWSDGWFRTGDIGKKDRLGRVYFVDRKKDVIKSGGYSVFSLEVEQELLGHPDIAEAAVIGVPHPTLGEAAVAVVALKEGKALSEDELLAWCAENIAHYKSPRRAILLEPGELPRTFTLKIMKRELRQRYSSLFEADVV